MGMSKESGASSPLASAGPAPPICACSATMKQEWMVDADGVRPAGLLAVRTVGIATAAAAACARMPS